MELEPNDIDPKVLIVMLSLVLHIIKILQIYAILLYLMPIVVAIEYNDFTKILIEKIEVDINFSFNLFIYYHNTTLSK